MALQNNTRHALDKITEIRANIKRGFYTPVAMTLDDVERDILDEIEKSLLVDDSKANPQVLKK